MKPGGTFVRCAATGGGTLDVVVRGQIDNAPRCCRHREGTFARLMVGHRSEARWPLQALVYTNYNAGAAE